MSSTDVSNLSAAVAGIQIDGPTTPTASGRIELNDDNILQVLPGEIDSAVGSVVQPTVIEDAANALTNAVADIIEEAVPGTFGDERLPVGANGDALFDPHVYDATIRCWTGRATTGAPGHVRGRREVRGNRRERAEAVRRVCGSASGSNLAGRGVRREQAGRLQGERGGGEHRHREGRDQGDGHARPRPGRALTQRPLARRRGHPVPV